MTCERWLVKPCNGFAFEGQPLLLRLINHCTSGAAQHHCVRCVLHVVLCKPIRMFVMVDISESRLLGGVRTLSFSKLQWSQVSTPLPLPPGACLPCVCIVSKWCFTCRNATAVRPGFVWSGGRLSGSQVLVPSPSARFEYSGGLGLRATMVLV